MDVRQEELACVARVLELLPTIGEEATEMLAWQVYLATVEREVPRSPLINLMTEGHIRTSIQKLREWKWFRERIAERQRWEMSMVRVRRIWDVLSTVWHIVGSEDGWEVYYAIEHIRGEVPPASDLTIELIRDGLLTMARTDEWAAWVKECAAAAIAANAKEQSRESQSPAAAGN